MKDDPYAGKRYRCIKIYDLRKAAVGEEGVCTQSHIAGEGAFLHIHFDIDIGGHSDGGRGKEGHCWNIALENLEEVMAEVVCSAVEEVKL